MKDQKNNLLVGLDIGTTEVRCLIGRQIIEDKQIKFKVLGFGRADNKGMKSGTISVHDESVEALEKAIVMAEAEADSKITSVSVNINGRHIKTVSCYGEVKVTSIKKIITDLECNSVEDLARQRANKKGSSLVQFFTNSYRVNRQEEIVDPLGLQAESLEIHALGVTASTFQIELLFKACDELELFINDLSVSSMAVAQATYNPQNWESGVAIIDIGYNTTNIAVIKDNKIESIKVLNMGGFHVTQDIAILLKVDLEVAEHLKIHHAQLNSTSRGTKTINLNGQTVNFPLKFLSQIVTARWEEFCDIIVEYFNLKDYNYLSGGIILAGGASQTKGLADMLQSKSEMYTRFGQLNHFVEIPSTIKDKPAFLTVAGLMAIDSGIQTVSRDILLDYQQSSKSWWNIFKRKG